MKAPVTLGLYGVGLAAVFAASFAVGAAVIPGWISQIEQPTHPSPSDHDGGPASNHEGAEK